MTSEVTFPPYQAWVTTAGVTLGSGVGIVALPADQQQRIPDQTTIINTPNSPDFFSTTNTATKNPQQSPANNVDITNNNDHNNNNHHVTPDTQNIGTTHDNDIENSIDSSDLSTRDLTDLRPPRPRPIPPRFILRKPLDETRHLVVTLFDFIAQTYGFLFPTTFWDHISNVVNDLVIFNLFTAAVYLVELGLGATLLPKAISTPLFTTTYTLSELFHSAMRSFHMVQFQMLLVNKACANFGFLKQFPYWVRDRVETWLASAVVPILTPEQRQAVLHTETAERAKDRAEYRWVPRHLLYKFQRSDIRMPYEYKYYPELMRKWYGDGHGCKLSWKKWNDKKNKNKHVLLFLYPQKLQSSLKSR